MRPLSPNHSFTHAIASRGGWRKDGTWVAVAQADPGAAEKLFGTTLAFVTRRSSCRRSTQHGSSRARCSASRTSIATIRRKKAMRDAAQQLYERAEWDWAQPRPPAITMG